MTRYIVTGPTKIGEADRLTIAEVIRKLRHVDEITTGAAHGVDTIAAIVGIDAHPGALHRIVIPSAPCNFAWAIAQRDRPGCAVVEMPFVDGEAYSDSYRRRNEAMFEPDSGAKRCLVAFLRRETFYRSGEWMTVNIAERLGVNVVKVTLAGGEL